MKEFLEWALRADAVINGEAAACPNCDSEGLRSVVVGDPQTRIGFGVVWCRTCFKAIYLSRIQIDDGVDFKELSAEGQQHYPEELDFVWPSAS